MAIVDPELTYDLPPALTASTGLDALTQLIEPYVCPRANPMTDGFCVEGIRRAGRSLREALCQTAQNKSAREDMAAGEFVRRSGAGQRRARRGPRVRRADRRHFPRAARRCLRRAAAARHGREPSRAPQARRRQRMLCGGTTKWRGC